MSMPSVQVRVRQFACFTRETKVEGSHTFIPVAALMCWMQSVGGRKALIVRAFTVLKPSAFSACCARSASSSRRLPCRSGCETVRIRPLCRCGQGTDGRRATTCLRDVRYWVERFPLVFEHIRDNSPAKYAEMMKRRVEKANASPTVSGMPRFGGRFGKTQADDADWSLSISADALRHCLAGPPGIARHS